MSESIALQIDRETAEDLRDALWRLGEHIAAGMPIGEFSVEANQRLAEFLRDLDVRLGGPGRFA